MGKLNDVHNGIRVLELLPSKAYGAGTVDGTGLDVTDFGGRAIAVLTCGEVSGTTPSAAVKLQESDVVGSGYTDISGGAFSAVGASAFRTLAKILTGLKKFVRATTTVTGSSTPIVNHGVVLIAAAAHSKPVSNPAA